MTTRILERHGVPPPPLSDVLGGFFTPDEKKTANAVAKQYAVIRGHFADAISSQAGGVESGSLSPEDFAASMGRVIRGFYLKTFALGKSITGKDPAMTIADQRAVKALVDDEVGYARKFGTAIGAGTSHMDTDARAAMYTKALDSVFIQGQVAGLPTDTTIAWRLGAGEHCADCVENADGGPYSADELPSIPGSGETQCLSNCLCSLEVLSAPESDDTDQPTDEEDTPTDADSTGDDGQTSDSEAPENVPEQPESDTTDDGSDEQPSEETPSTDAESETPDSTEPEPESGTDGDGGDGAGQLGDGTDGTGTDSTEEPPEAADGGDGAGDGSDNVGGVGPGTEGDDTSVDDGAYPAPDDVPLATVTQTDAEGTDVDPTVAASMLSLAGAAAYWRQRSAIATGEDRKVYANNRMDAEDDLERESNANDVDVEPVYTPSELKHAVRGLSDDDLIGPDDPVSVDDSVAIVKGRSVWMAMMLTCTPGTGTM